MPDMGNFWETGGRRVLKQGIGASDSVRQRTRYFFQGLTEAIRKVSVSGGHSDNAFARNVLFDGESTPSGWSGSTVSKVSDSNRRSNVYQSPGTSTHGKLYSETGNGDNITGKRTFSAWLYGGGATTSAFAIHIETDVTRRAFYFDSTTGSVWFDGPVYGDEECHIPMGGTNTFKTVWSRIERDLAADTASTWGETLVRVTGVQLLGTSSTYKMNMDDLTFSNSLTVEHDTLGPGSIGHILRHRTINTSTYAATDVWYHYDQVGSVMAESNSSGALSTQDWQDAYGNSQSSFTTGLFGGTQSGFHHNTKGYLN